MKPIVGPTNLELTTDWYNIQFTNLHQYHPVRSQEYNKIIKAFGRGSFFVVAGYKLGLFKAIVNGKQTCIARLTPGIHVHDFTIIDFIQPMKLYKKFIYIKLFDEDDKPIPKQVYKIGSRYYHGIIGDGINATPTYDIIQSIRDGADRTNFRTFYSLRLDDEYGLNGELIDIPHIEVDDFRFPPNDTDPSDPEDPWKPFVDLEDPDNENSNDEDEYDYTTLVARSQAIMWSLIVDGFSA